MKKLLKRLSLTSRGLRHELAIAFGLVIMALLVFIAYLFPDISPVFAVRTNLGIVVTILLFIVVLGFVTIVQIVEPILKISRVAKGAVFGDALQKIKLAKADKIGGPNVASNSETPRYIKDKAEQPEAVENLTGLYNRTLVKELLNEEIERVVDFQRPCAFIILTVDRFDAYRRMCGRFTAEDTLIKIGAILRGNIDETDKAARFGDHEFALILPEKNKRQAIEIAEKIRKRIESLFLNEDGDKKLTCAGAVTENPVDGVSGDDLIFKALDMLDTAREQGGNRICYKV